MDNIDKLYIGFRPNAKYKDVSKADSIDRYEVSDEYHYMYIEGEVVVPFQKLEMLGKILEFPFNCQAIIACGDVANNIIYPMYTDANNVIEIVLNLSNGTKKTYNADRIYNEFEEIKKEDIYKDGIVMLDGRPVLFRNIRLWI